MDLRTKLAALEALPNPTVSSIATEALDEIERLRKMLTDHRINPDGDYIGRQPKRCAECDCSFGGADCNWIKAKTDGTR